MTNPAPSPEEPLDLYEEAFALFAALETAGVPYCLIGGVALGFYVNPRYTMDIDFLTTPEAAATAAAAVTACGFKESAEPWTFRSTGVTLWRFVKFAGPQHLLVDLLYGGDERTRRVIAGALRDDSARGPVRVAAADDLIWLKQQRSSPQDLADIAALRGEDRPDGPPPIRGLPERPPLPDSDPNAP